MVDSTTAGNQLKCSAGAHYFHSKPDDAYVPHNTAYVPRVDQKCECGLIVYGDLEDIV